MEKTENTPKRVLVTGFAHSGTSILRCKIGECPNVFDVPLETRACIIGQMRMDQAKQANMDFIVMKTPFLPRKPIQKRFEHVILVLRNPYNVFTSLRKRFCPNLPLDQRGGFTPRLSIFAYKRTLDFFLEHRKLDPKETGVHCITYDELFLNDGQKLKSILDEIGIKYEEGFPMVHRKDYPIQFYPGDPLEANVPTEAPPMASETQYRLWQVNQEFKNMNGEVVLDPFLEADIDTMLPLIAELGWVKAKPIVST